MRCTPILSGILAGGALLASVGAQSSYDPRLGPFVRLNESRPILSPQGDGFEAAGVFNPAVVKDGDRFVMLYRAQDKQGISRLGYATSTDGVTFTREATPVLGPEAEYERGGGVEDPRLVKIDGLYYLTYTAYNGKDAQLALATSRDLRRWERKGVILPAYKGRWNVNWTKAGAILPQRVGGRYWMYYMADAKDARDQTGVAYSTDLITWTEALDHPVLPRRAGRFDSRVAEPGPPPMLTPDGVLLIYNGADDRLVYRTGWALFDRNDPTRLIARSDQPLFEPLTEWEKVGQVPNVVFVEGLVAEPGRWLVYYGAADKHIGVASVEAALAAGQDATAAPPAAALPAATFKKSVDAAGIVGASLLVIKDGRVLTHETVGYQDLDSKAPTAPATIYHWASITKTFTGIAIMQLRDRGLLTLDTPAVKYVPELRLVHNPFGDISQVTIRTLMQHAAGFRAPTWPWGGDKSWHPYEPTSWEQLAAMLPYTELLFEPGTQYRYSNPGIVFLGRIIQELSGEDFEVYVTKNILTPLGMHRTFFDRAPYHLLPDRSHSYFRTDGTLAEGRFDFDTGITVSNGGLNAPLTDMALYLQFLMGEPMRPVYDVVLKRSSLEEMWTPTLAARDGEGGSGDHVKIGLSFFVERYGDVELIGHSGDQNGFISHLYLHRPSHTAWVVNFNTEVTTKGAARSKTREVDDAVRDAVIAHLIRSTG